MTVSAVLAYVSMVTWISWHDSPVVDEAAHYAAGLYWWKFHRADIYQVNPPLVKAVATSCFDLSEGVEPDYGSVSVKAHRPEWGVAVSFMRSNAEVSQWMFFHARMNCLPFDLLGALIVWRWSRELYGTVAGAAGVVAYCFSPMVVAWSATRCPDVAGATIGLLTLYLFWKWICKPTWSRSFVAGCSLGIALLANFTWFVALVSCPIIALVLIPPETYTTPRRIALAFGQLFVFISVALLVLRAGYGVTEPWPAIGEVTFKSIALAGEKSVVSGKSGGIIFRGTFCESWIIPIPEPVMEGLDIQKLDFELGQRSHLWGRWSDGGCWYYYILCSLFKTSVGSCIGFLCCVFSFFASRDSRSRTLSSGASPVDAVSAAECLLALTACVLFVFVSSQTGINSHFRYQLPVFPMVGVLITRV